MSSTGSFLSHLVDIVIALTQEILVDFDLAVLSHTFWKQFSGATGSSALDKVFQMTRASLTAGSEVLKHEFDRMAF